MNTPYLQLTIRDLRAFMGQRHMWLILASVAVLASIAQPFGFRVPGHIGLTVIYWLMVVFITFPMGFFTTNLSDQIFKPYWLTICMAACTMGVLVTALVYILNVIFLGWPFIGLDYLMVLAPSSFISAAIITAVVHIALPSSMNNTALDVAENALLQRLPFDKRAPIVHLEAQDHYTHVTTQKGAELLLLRFADAMAEVGAQTGYHVHRSHWISKHAIRSIKRKGDGAIITLTNGVDVPVSRSKTPQLRDAGLL